jgi:hypothetical protein
MISQIEKVGGQTRSNISDGAAYGIEIHCKVNKRKNKFFFLLEKKFLFLGFTSILFWKCKRTKSKTKFT